MRSILHFGGLGDALGPPLDGLKVMSGMPYNARFFAAACGAVEEALEAVGLPCYASHLPDGLPLRDWLAGTVRPAQDRLRTSIVEGVCLHVYQLCLLQPGPARPRGLRGARAAIGHSLGTYAALFAAQRIEDRREFIELSARSIMQVTVALLRSHQILTSACTNAELMKRYDSLVGRAESDPAPMASVLGLSRLELTAAIDGHNATVPTLEGTSPNAGPVEIGLVNTANFHVLTGGTEALLRFRVDRHDLFSRSRVRWRFLPGTAPFHSSALRPAMKWIAADLDRIWGRIGGDRLEIPVYGTGSPANLQHCPDLLYEVAEQQMCRVFDWPAVVAAAAAGHEPELVLDFGPGPTVQVLTRACLREAGLGPSFASVA